MQGKTAKKLVFGSNFVTYGAPFYKWCRFTYGAVTAVIKCKVYIHVQLQLWLKHDTILSRMHMNHTKIINL